MKTVVITGAADGIGLQTAKVIAEAGHAVVIHGRSISKCKSAVEKIADEFPYAELDFAAADFSSLAEVRRMSNELIGKFPKIDVLINNAGIYMTEKQLSLDGFEMTFAVNHLAPFLLTNLLLKNLPAGGRVVNVSSMAHQRGNIDWGNLNAEKFFDGYAAYALSKLAGILFSNKLARLVNKKGITSNSLHPGVITTKLLAKGFNMTGAAVERGAETSVFLALSDEVENAAGKYFSDSREVSPSPIALDSAVQDKLWDVSSKMTGLL